MYLVSISAFCLLPKNIHLRKVQTAFSANLNICSFYPHTNLFFMQLIRSLLIHFELGNVKVVVYMHECVDGGAKRVGGFASPRYQ